MKRLLLVDGPNVVMHCAFGGNIDPKGSVPTAMKMIRRLAEWCEATHMIVCWDTPVDSWRRAAFADYKGHRTVDTVVWCLEGEKQAAEAGWLNMLAVTHEADDVIATLATRAAARGTDVFILSGDSDLWQVLGERVTVVKPCKAGEEPTVITAADVPERVHGFTVAQLADFKALRGEPGDNLPGPWGKKTTAKATKVLQLFGTLDDAIKGGAVPPSLVEQTKLVRRLVELRTDVPIPPIAPATCALHLPQPAAAAGR